jgi:hypothetical protein
MLGRILVPDFELDDSFIDPDQMAEGPARSASGKHEPTPKSSEFASVWRLICRQHPRGVHCVATVKKRKSTTERKAIQIKSTNFSSFFE